jgi:hypothetical protein
VRPGAELGSWPTRPARGVLGFLSRCHARDDPTCDFSGWLALKNGSVCTSAYGFTGVFPGQHPPTAAVSGPPTALLSTLQSSTRPA